MKVLCIYHKNCPDGITSAWVVSKKFPNAMFVPANPNSDLFQDVLGSLSLSDIFDQVIIVDISFAKDSLIKLNQMVPSLVVLDHHISAKRNLDGLDFCKFDTNESGASMAWKYFFPGEDIPLLVRYIKDRDLWLFKEPHSHEITSYIMSYNLNFDTLDDLNSKFSSLGVDELSKFGEVIHQYKTQLIDAHVRNAIITDILGYTAATLNATTMASDIGHELCKKFPGAAFAAIYRDDLIRRLRVWSLRSIGDFDVSKIASQFGGGGHKNAAGFVTPLPTELP